ncbi:MAG: ATP-binding protein [Thermodesulfobacteriota bacterium]
MSLFREEFEVVGNDFIHAGEASLKIKNILKELGVDPDLMRRVAIAAYEGEINQVIHAEGGTMALELLDDGILIIFEDEGPGIPDVELAMQEGYSTASEEARAMGFGAGMGLPNIRKNSDEFELNSRVGRGTKLVVKFHHSWDGDRT